MPLPDDILIAQTYQFSGDSGEYWEINTDTESIDTAQTLDYEDRRADGVIVNDYFYSVAGTGDNFRINLNDKTVENINDDIGGSARTITAGEINNTAYIVIGYDNDTLTAYDVNDIGSGTATPVWETATYIFTGQIQHYNEEIHCVSDGYKVFDLATGDLKRQNIEVFDSLSGGNIDISPNNNAVYLIERDTGSEGRVASFDLDDASTIWHNTTFVSKSSGPLVYQDNTIYVSDSNGKLNLLDPDTGSSFITLDVDIVSRQHALARDENLVYGTDGTNITIIDEDTVQKEIDLTTDGDYTSNNGIHLYHPNYNIDAETIPTTLFESDKTQITRAGAELLIKILSGQESEQITEHSLGDGIVTNRREQTELDSPSTLNDNWTNHSVDISGDTLTLTSKLELTDDEIQELDNLSELGILTDSNTLLQYKIIDIDSNDVET